MLYLNSNSGAPHLRLSLNFFVSHFAFLKHWTAVRDPPHFSVLQLHMKWKSSSPPDLRLFLSVFPVDTIIH